MLADPLIASIARAQLSARDRAEALRRRLPELARLLLEQGATRVVLFGSLATGAPPHAGTDLDLCVWGLDESGLGAVALEAEARGIPADFVRGERLSERLAKRIGNDGVEVPLGP